MGDAGLAAHLTQEVKEVNDVLDKLWGLRLDLDLPDDLRCWSAQCRCRQVVPLCEALELSLRQFPVAFAQQWAPDVAAVLLEAALGLLGRQHVNPAAAQAITATLTR